MAEAKATELMEKIVSLCKRRGLIFQSSEIYGGINGFWDYGPLGAELKRNVKDYWWRCMTQQRNDIVGLDATIVMHPKVWEASGHTSTFSDPMVDCLLTKKRFRADQIEPQSGTLYSYTGSISESYFHYLTFGFASTDFYGITSPNPKSFFESEDEKKSLKSWFNEEKIKDDIEAARSLTFEFCNKVQKQAPAWKNARGEALSLYLEYRDAKKFNGWNPQRENMLFCAIDALISSTIHYSVIVPKGKPAEKARKTAVEFYKSRGIENPILFGEESSEVESDVRHNPENGSLLTEPRAFNLMFKTYVGPVESEDNVAYLRPETAQAIFVQFKNVLESSRQKVPFGICQVGKAFRNEINPRNFTFRSREFEQMEVEFFIRPDEVVEKIAGSVQKVDDGTTLGDPQPNWGWEAWHKYWVDQRIQWYASIGLPVENLHIRHQTKEELAHYARATADIEFDFPFGTQELEGIAARSDYDLSQHQEYSGKSQIYFDEEAKEKYVPHVIEPSAGVDRLVLALICNAYDEDEAPNEKGTMEKRVVLRFHPRIAPYKVAVFPLVKNKPEIVAKAREVQKLLMPHMSVFYDESGAIGRRYRRQDEIGTPFCVTIDFDTLGEKPELLDTVTLRDRDTMEQQRLPIRELTNALLEKIR